jgi:glycine/D-amino acid oxidase-like deaminating enzyme/nitrite reductase/ring-hydroxylating ferredoxin subunit
MRPESGKTLSVWAATADVPAFAPLTENLDVEVCVVGGGIAGLTTAYMLAQQGRQVIVIDDNDIAGGETHRTTAHLSNAFDDRYFEVIRMFGKKKARLVYESHTQAIDTIEQIALAEGINCDFKRVPGYLFCAPGQSVNDLKKELKACQEIGFDSVQMRDITPFGKTVQDAMPCIEFPQQGQFHVLKYIRGLANAIVRMGGRIFTYTHVDEIIDGEPATVKTSTGSVVKAQWVAVTTNSPVSDYARVYLQEAAFRTYVVAARVDAGYVNESLFWDMQDPYHYIRTQPIEGSDQLWLIVGGEDHRTGHDEQPRTHFANLEEYVRTMFPAVREIEHHWSGQVMEPADGLALIGKDPERGANILISTGDSGMGMTHGTIGGIILSDIIVGNENPWTDLYNPARWPIHAPFETLREAVGMAAGYTRYLSGSEVDSIDEIAPGTGAVVNEGAKKVAAYRDMNGRLHQFSAACPHMKAVLQFNNCEQTWDCPAHGSRFTAEGEVVNGPAICNMQQLSLTDAPADWIPPSDQTGMSDEAR